MTSQVIDIRIASQEERPVIEAMMERYLPDFGVSGPYPNLELYWQDTRRSPYLICTDTEAVGFALVQQLDQNTRELVEFYLHLSHRGRGIARRAASLLFGVREDHWRVGVRKDNSRGMKFWNAYFANNPSVVTSEIAEPPALIYKFVGREK